MICDQYTDSFHKEIPSAELRSHALRAQGSKKVYANVTGAKEEVLEGRTCEVLIQIQ
jgi:hypothetical protein